MSMSQALVRFSNLALTGRKADLLVSSAGCGTIQHALRHGVLVVTTGLEQDKPQPGIILEMKHVGVWQLVLQADKDELREHIDKVLNDASYNETALKFRDTDKSYSPNEKLHNTIQKRMAEFDRLTA